MTQGAQAKILLSENGVTVTSRKLLLPAGEHDLSVISELVATWRHRGWMLVAMGLCVVAAILIEAKVIPLIVLAGFGCFYLGIGIPHRLYFRTREGETVTIASGDIDRLTKLEKALRKALETRANDNSGAGEDGEESLQPLAMRMPDDQFESAEPMARTAAPPAAATAIPAPANQGAAPAKPRPKLAVVETAEEPAQADAPPEPVPEPEPDPAAGKARAEAAALEQLRVNAATGDIEAQAGLGTLLLSRRIAARDAGEAAFWLRKAAAAGHARAGAHLGLLYAKGEGGMPTDPTAAEHCWQRAAEAGDALGMALLAECYEADGDPERREAAGEWYRKAADAGEPRALYRLGLRAEAVDPPAALAWYRKAGALGDAPAWFAAARLLSQGPAALRDLEQAAACFLAAARLDHALAQAETGRCYAEGTGVPADPARAWYWFDRAVAAGLPHAAARREALAQGLDEEARHAVGRAVAAEA